MDVGFFILFASFSFVNRTIDAALKVVQNVFTYLN